MGGLLKRKEGLHSVSILCRSKSAELCYIKVASCVNFLTKYCIPAQVSWPRPPVTLSPPQQLVGHSQDQRQQPAFGFVTLSPTATVLLLACFLAFNNATVPPSAHATFSYIFVVRRYWQPRSFDLVGTIIYEIDQKPYQNVFYNGTIEVTQFGDVLTAKGLLLMMIANGIFSLLLFPLYGVTQSLLKGPPKAKVEVGTATTDASMDEGLQGTSYAQSLSNKSKKK